MMASVKEKRGQAKKIVLAYSGGLDTSCILHWLKEKYGAEVIAFVADIGQREDFEGLRKKAILSGASKVFVEDLKEEFVRDYIFPALRANAVYESGYLMGTSLARPIIARKQMEIAKREGANAVSHGATGKGNDQIRFEMAYIYFNPGIEIIAPWRIWEFKSRSDLIEYAKKAGIPVPTTPDRPYSSDHNIFHISFEGGILEDPWMEPPDNMFVLTVSPEKAREKPTYLEIGFEKGDPVQINGKPLDPVPLLVHLNALGGENGIGRLDMVENRYTGMKSRGVYETPGGTILHIAHQALESITLDREVMHLRNSLIPYYAKVIYNGYWFSPEKDFLQSAIDCSQEKVSGTVRLKLYKGNCQVAGRKSPNSLYSKDIATFEEGTFFDQRDAKGFIQINALRLRMKAWLEERERIKL